MPMRTIIAEHDGILERPHALLRAVPNQRVTKKKPNVTDHIGFSFLVRLAGIEPTTLWFVARYSIQLSYSRISPKL